jgi:uncharacterized protein YukJ
MSNRHVKNYGVWKAQPVTFNVDGPGDKTPHIQLYFQDDDGQHRAAINVKSSGAESRLVYWLNRDLKTTVTDRFDRLDIGFHRINGEEGLDYYRDDGLIDFKRGRALPSNQKGPNNDIIDQIVPILQDAIDGNATIYFFGAMFNDRNESGIHDIHMNQGSLPKFENGVNQDGGFFVQYENHWEGVFLAFASQRLPTDNDTGLAKSGAIDLVDWLNSGKSPLDLPERFSKQKGRGNKNESELVDEAAA